MNNCPTLNREERMGREMNEFFKPEICKKCGGTCCLRLPAPYTPKDIQAIFGGIEQAIQSGKVAIDNWENPILYFMRPKTVLNNNLYDPSWGGACIHHKSNGCELPRDKMPTYCKTLEPKEDGCDNHFKKENSKFWAGILWKKSKVDLRKFI